MRKTPAEIGVPILGVALQFHVPVEMNEWEWWNQNKKQAIDWSPLIVKYNKTTI